MHTVEIFLAFNEHGDAAVSLEEASEARAMLLAEFGGEAVRAIKLTVSTELPEVTEVDVEVPAGAEDEAVEIEAHEETEEAEHKNVDERVLEPA